MLCDIGFILTSLLVLRHEHFYLVFSHMAGKTILDVTFSLLCLWTVQCLFDIFHIA